MSVDRIDVVCDDPRHGGRLFEIEVFVRHPYESIDGGLVDHWLAADDADQLGAIDSDPLEHHSRRGAGEPVYVYRCELCPPKKKPQQLACTGSTLQWLLNAVSAQGVSQPTLRLLNLLLSNRT